MYQTRNTLPETIREQSVEILNKHLAAGIDLQAQVKQAHWNVRGPGFIALHELFDRVALEVGKSSDLLAERAAALGGTAYGTIQLAVERSFLIPYPLGIAGEKEHVFAISGALAAFGQSLVEAIGRLAGINDYGSADLLTQISRSNDQLLWLVESHIPHP